MMHKPLSTQAATHYIETWNGELSRDKKYKEATQKRTREMQLRSASKDEQLFNNDIQRTNRIR